MRSQVWPNDFNRRHYTVDFYGFHCYSRNLGLGEHGVRVPRAFGEFGVIGHFIEEQHQAKEPGKNG